ncbi:MAG: GldG family protein [Acidobacteria bacterium]|nr:GldG family protein [Acidobacteriota bacterium]
MKKYLQKLDTLGLVLLVAAVIWYSVTDTWGKGNLGLAIAGAALFVVGIGANYRQIMASLGRRSTRYATNYVVSLLLVIAIVAGLNFIGQRHVKRFDTTGNRQFSLAPQTLQVLEKLGGDVDIKAFFPGGDYAPLRDLLVQYRTASRRVRFEFIDPDRQPEVARQYDVSVYGAFQNPLTGTQLKYGTVVLAYGDRREKIEKRSEEVQEQDLTNAIIRVGRSESKKVYFVQGHGEKDPSDTEQSGYSQARKGLEDQGYEVDVVNLATEGKVPEDAGVLVIAGARTAPFEQEMGFVDDFLQAGGGVLLMTDPVPAPSHAPFLQPWGIRVDDNVVLDVSGAGRLMGAGPSIPLVLEYDSHPITDRFDAMTFFPLTRSVRPAEEQPEGVTVQTLFRSNPNSWGETDMSTPEASFGPEDLQGPLPLAVAATREIRAGTDDAAGLTARLVVVGTSNFAIDAYFGNQGNGNLFLNMVSWLAQDEDLISIRPKQAEDRRILLSQSQLSGVRLVSMFLIPGIAFVAGIVVYLNRRRK